MLENDMRSKKRLCVNIVKIVYYFEMFRFCRITDRSSLRISRNENGGRFRLILVRDDDEEDAVLLDEVEDLAVRSCEPEMSAVDCLSLGSPISLDHNNGATILPSTSSPSMVDDVEADRKGGILVEAIEHCGFSSVGLLLALVAVLSDDPMIIFECFPPIWSSVVRLSEKSKMEFCSFVMDSEELELALTGISSKSFDFVRFGDLSSNRFGFLV